MRIARRVGAHDVLIASLQGPYPFSYPFGLNGFAVHTPAEMKIGFGWATRWKDTESIKLHHRNLLRLIDRVSREYPVNSDKIFLLGFSQPVALNYRFVFTHPDTIRGVIAVCGGLPGDWETGAYRKSNTDVLHIATDRDPYYPLERSRLFESRLATRARHVEFNVYPEGHRFPRRAFPQIAAWFRERV